MVCWLTTSIVAGTWRTGIPRRVVLSATTPVLSGVAVVVATGWAVAGGWPGGSCRLGAGGRGVSLWARVPGASPFGLAVLGRGRLGGCSMVMGGRFGCSV